MSDVTDNAPLHRFEMTENGQLAFATYRRNGERVVIPHVEAAIPLRGTGAAGRLMEGIAGLARSESFKIVPTCPYAVAWFRRHPEASDVLGTA